MRFSVVVYPFDRWRSIDELLEAVQYADEVGIGSIGLAEHIVNPIPAGSTEGLLPNQRWFDNVALAGAIAARTQQIRILLSAFIIPYRNPVLAAKSLATLDQLSGGRIGATVGAGWLEAEFDALGIPFHERGSRTDDHLDAMVALWTQERPSFEGPFTSFSDLTFEPKCVQQPHVPLMIGGTGRRVLRRVLRVGAGWAPMTGTLEDLSPAIDWLRENAPMAGRNPAELQFFTRIEVLGGDQTIRQSRAHSTGVAEQGAIDDEPSVEQVVARAGPFAAAGFHELGVSFPWQSAAEWCERCEWLVKEVQPHLPA